MAYESVIYEVKDGVASITLNRPDAYNALNLPLARDLFHATLEADEDRALQIASQVVGYTEYPMEVRRIMDHSAQP